jgi:uncharacterized protein YozE (UPF0346 family)
MTFKKFVKSKSKEDSPVGDLASDIMRDKNFPWDYNIEQIFDYLKNNSNDPSYRGSVKEFKKEYWENQI